MPNRKRLVLLLVIVFVLLLLAACSNENQTVENEIRNEEPESQKANEEVKTKETPQTVSPEKVELILYSNVGDGEDSVRQLMIEPLMNELPHIEMKYIQASSERGTTMDQMLASGEKFDIFYHGRGPYETTLVDYQIMYDMTDLIQKHGVDITHLEPTAMDSIQEVFEDGIYGIPISLNSLLLFYNKQLFDRFGVDYPENGMTWDEIFVMAGGLTRNEGEEQYYGFGMNGTAQMLGMNSYSIPFADGAANKPTINTDERWRTLFQTMFLNPVMTEIYQTAGRIPNWQSFSGDQNLAMLLYTIGAIGAFQNELEQLDWEMVSLPVYSDLPNVGSRSNPVYYGVTSLSENPDAAMEAIKFWISDDYQLGRSLAGHLMSSQKEDVKQALGKESPFPDKNWAAITYHPFAPLAPMVEYDSKIRSVISNHLPSLLSGEVDLNTALRTMEEEAEQVIAEHLSGK